MPTDDSIANCGAELITVHVWRHPQAQNAGGICVGRTDLAVDRRKAKNLAHRIRSFARRHDLPREIVTSPLQRSAVVGRVLAAWGWTHHIEPLLVEVDFGRWEGRAWNAISRSEIDQWCADLMNNMPGSGENVRTLLLRVNQWRPLSARLAVGHGGWLSAALWLERHGPLSPDATVTPRDWPPPPGLGTRQTLLLATKQTKKQTHGSAVDRSPRPPQPTSQEKHP